MWDWTEAANLRTGDEIQVPGSDLHEDLSGLTFAFTVTTMVRWREMFKVGTTTGETLDYLGGELIWARRPSGALPQLPPEDEQW